MAGGTPSRATLITHSLRGFVYGDGIFEGIRAYNGRVFRLREHLDLLYDSAWTIDLAIPVTKEEITGIILCSIAALYHTVVLFFISYENNFTAYRHNLKSKKIEQNVIKSMKKN